MAAGSVEGWAAEGWVAGDSARLERGWGGKAAAVPGAGDCNVVGGR